MERQTVLGWSLLLGFLLSFSAPVSAIAANVHRIVARRTVHPMVHEASNHFISCVPYARAQSGIDIIGNAWQWWGRAAGHYARGQAPSPGAVLAFRAIPRMPLGHVAVVARIVNAREILVDQANWLPAGQIRLDVPVVDVSPENNWTAVRVGNGTGHLGTVYPTYGFIYPNAPGRAPVMLARRDPLPLPPLPEYAMPDYSLRRMPFRKHPVEVAEGPFHRLGPAIFVGHFRLAGTRRGAR